MAQATLARNLFGEIGTTGLNAAHGTLGEEFLRELQGPRGMRVYREMAHNDAIVGAMLFAIEQLARQVKWLVSPARKGENASERVAALVRTALFEDMSTTWQDTLTEILSMLPYGWAWLEVIYKQRGGDVEDPARRSKFTDGQTAWRKWAIRAQDSLHEWRFDPEGGIQAIVQRVGFSDIRVIPIAKSLLFRTNTFNNNPEGRSILRNAYRSWYFKRRTEEVEGIGIERDLAGYPVFKVAADGPDLWNEADEKAVALRKKIEKIVKNIRRDAQEGLVLPAWLDFSLVASASRRAFDTNGVITRYDQRIAMTTLSDFILLGHDRVGTFALSTDKTHLFSAALGGYLDAIVQVINTHAIPVLLRLNGEPPELAPKLEHGRIEQRDLVALATYVKELRGVELIRPNPDLERALLDAGDLPLPDDEKEAA